MFTIKNIEITDAAVAKLVKCLTSFWFGVPSWLRSLLIVVIVGGASYFLYTRLSMSYDVEELQTEIAYLNEKCNTTVFYDRYIYDISNLIDATQNLEYEIDLLYDFHNELSDLLLEYIHTHHPDDKMKREVENIKKRIENTKKSYDKILKYEISLYENWQAPHKNYEKTLQTDSITKK